MLLLDTWLSLAAACAIYHSTLVQAQGLWPRSAVLDRDGNFHIEWWVENDEKIFFKVEVRTHGYAAIGFSRDGTMVDSDMVIGWVSEGKTYLQDRHAYEHKMPILDDRQDWILISGCENETHTTLQMWRKLNTCDPQDFALEFDNTVRIIYSYSLKDPPNEWEIPYHGKTRRGSRSFVLLQPEMPRETDVEFWDVLTNDFSVSPEWDTMYWCKMFRGPDIKEKHHVTMVESLILGGNRGNFVHHAVLYDCPQIDPSEYERYVGEDGCDCMDANIPHVFNKCDGAFAQWAIGGEGLVLPDHVGFPLYPRPSRYYVLQVHYDNANRVQGSPGQAGFRIHHTANIREHDGAMFMIGADIGPSILLPPGARNFVVAAHSNPDCTGSHIPSEGVQIISTTLHTHSLGRSVKTRHFRNNKELRPLINNKHYDSNYQAYQYFKENILLLPRDQLTIECTFDNNRTRTAMGGNSTRDEMCLLYVVYYPKFEGLYGSRSRVPKETNVELINSDELTTLTAGNPVYDQEFIDFMTNYDWKETDIRSYIKGFRFSEQETFCNIGGGNITSVRTSISYPTGLQEYTDPPYCPAAEK